MKTLQNKSQLFSNFGLAHAIATGVVNFIGAGWYINKYSHSEMQGYDVHLPFALVVLEYLGKGLMLPLVPIIYSWEPMFRFPIGLAVILNSSLIAFTAWLTWTKIEKARRGTRR